jgi:cytoskeletal protein CcmA (bactofilin family)
LAQGDSEVKGEMATFRPDEENSVYIGHGAELTGAIRARDSIVIDGAFEGEIACNHLVVGQNGVVKGQINVTSADVAGQVGADIVAKNYLTVRATGRIEGKWDCGVIEVERGAVLIGAGHVAEASTAQRREPRAAETVVPAPAPAAQYHHTPIPAAPPPAAAEPEAPPPPVVEPIAPRRLAQLNLRVPRRYAAG